MPGIIRNPGCIAQAQRADRLSVTHPTLAACVATPPFAAGRVLNGVGLQKFQLQSQDFPGTDVMALMPSLHSTGHGGASKLGPALMQEIEGK
jgi:hypothetical protein